MYVKRLLIAAVAAGSFSAASWAVPAGNYVGGGTEFNFGYATGYEFTVGASD